MHSSFIPGQDGVGLCYNVNKTADIILQIVSRADPQDVIIKKDTVYDVSAAGDVPACYMWDEKMPGGREVLKSDNIEFRIHAAREVSSETTPVLTSQLQFRDAFRRPADNIDPLTLSGGWTGNFQIAVADGTLNTQVASGEADAHVETSFRAKKYSPLRVGYDVVVAHRNDFRLTTRVKYDTRLKYRAWVQVYRT